MSPNLDQSAHLRARRWDVLVLGSALPGLAAAVRLAMGGMRVLVAEEEATARIPNLLREPFFLPATRRDSVSDSSLRALGLAPIERHELGPDSLAFQVLMSDARVDVGDPALTSEELVAWGLAKPEPAEALIRELQEAARAERDAILEGNWLRRSGLRGLGRRATPTPAPGHSQTGGVRARGLPEALGRIDPPLARFFDAQVRALSNLPGDDPAPEAVGRLLGSVLEGGARFVGPDGGVRARLLRRLEALHGEVRTLGCPFQLVELGEHPGIARSGPGDIWLGRALVVNAPPQQLGSALNEWGFETPRFLDGPVAGARRVRLHLRAMREVVPEPLSNRAIFVPDPNAPVSGDNVVTLSLHPSPRGSRFAELVASAVFPWTEDGVQQQAQRLEAAVAELLPFAGERIRAAPMPPPPRWDDEGALLDGGSGGWPAPAEIRVGGRRPIYRLPREHAAGLGVEGDLMLGWRAGDAIRDDLT
jgi:hypothetical protein